MSSSSYFAPHSYLAPGYRIRYSSSNGVEFARSPTLSFVPGEIPLDSLEGSYDLIFFHADPPAMYFSGPQHILTQGTIEISTNEDSLQGFVKLPRAKEDKFFLLDGLKQNSLRFEGDSPHQIEVPNSSSIFQDGYDFIGATGTVKLVSRRHAIPFCASSDCSNPYFASSTEYEHDIQFDYSLEHAQALLDEYQAIKRSPLLWLCHHLDIPALPSSLVHDVLCTKPAPVVFFEERDIVIEIEWSPDTEDMDESICTSFIGRKRKAT